MKILLMVGIMFMCGCANDPYGYEAARYIAAGAQGFSEGYNAHRANNPVYLPPVYVPPMQQVPIVSTPPTPYVPIPPTIMPTVY